MNTLPRHLRRVLVAARGVHDITPEAVAADTGLTVDSVRRHLATLVTQGFLMSRTQYLIVKGVR